MESTSQASPGIAFGTKTNVTTLSLAARSKGVKVPQNTLSDPRAVLCAYLHKRIPRTSDGAIAGLLRADLLDSTQTPQDYTLVSAFPEEAFIEFNLDEGFPALPDGRPIWFKLDYEPPELFAAFELYVESINSGPRHVAQLLDSAELEVLLGDNLNMNFLRNVYYLYFWKDRARAYDTFQDAAYRHIRMRRALSTEDSAYIQADSMLKKVNAVFEEPKFWEQLEYDPKVALDYFKELLKIKRVAAGLPGAAPSGEDGSSTFEMIMRKVQEETKSSLSDRTPGAMFDAGGRLVADDDNFLKGALGDPTTAKAMQEVIIRMTKNRGATKQPRWSERVAGASPDGDNMERLPDGLSQGDLPGE